jgi:hypothetical protein
VPLGAFVAWLAFGAATASSACACGEINGVPVARGQSRGGQQWNQVAASSRGRLRVDIDFPGSSGGGFETSPFGGGDWAHITSGSGFPPPDPYEFDGATDRRVRQIDVRLRDGSLVTIRPWRPPLRARRHHRFLRKLRFFVVFYSSPSEPVRGIVRDGRGRVIQTFRSLAGLFI